MKHANQFLLEKTFAYNKPGGLEKLGKLPAEFFDTIGVVMQEFAEETCFDLIERLNKGESVVIRGKSYSLKNEQL